MPRVAADLRRATSPRASSRGVEPIITVLLPICMFSDRRCPGICCTCSQYLVESRHGQVDMFPLQNVGRKKAKNRFTGSVNDDPTLHHLCCNALRQFRRVEFETQHQTHPSNLHDALLLCFETFESGL